MPSNYSFTENGIVYNFDDVFVPSDSFILSALWTWGDNAYGQLGINNTNDRSIPVTTFAGGNNWKSIACGGYHTIAIKTDGSLWTWGRNSYGQLGINNTIDRRTPITTIVGGSDWKQISGGTHSTAAIKTDGSLWVWGRNFSGSLGINNTIHKSTPVTTFAGGNNWKSIIHGNTHMVTLKTDGTLWTWGDNFFGQLGINNLINRSTPVTTFAGGNDWNSIHPAPDHILAIKTDGSLWLWGRNTFGALGINTPANNHRSFPVTTFAGGNNWKSAAGGYYTAAIKTDGTLWTWGRNTEGALGINNTIDRSTPVTTILGGNNWKSIFGTKFSVASIKTDGSLWTWGSNVNGTLGINTVIDKSTPVTTILGGNNWKTAATGDVHIAAIKY